MDDQIASAGTLLADIPALRREIEAVHDQLHFVMQAREKAEYKHKEALLELDKARNIHAGPDEQLATLRRERDELREKLDLTVTELVVARQERDDVWGWLKDANKKFDELQELGQINAREAVLTQHIHQLEHRIVDLESSTSWRITTPLRAVKKMLGMIGARG